VELVPGGGIEPPTSGPYALQIMSFANLTLLALYQLSHPGTAHTVSQSVH
jgi:hypothetical protein